MKVEELSVDVIKPYEKNPRKNDGAVNGVAESIKQFGFQQPIVVDKDNVIVAGHTRYKAAKKLGLKTVPCVRASELTKEQVKAYRILDNKLNELATWDFDALTEELKSFKFDFEGFKFAIPEFNFSFESAANAASVAGFGRSPEQTEQTPFATGEWTEEDEENLPDEIRGADLSPSDLPPIEPGDNSGLRERIIIVYKKEDEEKLARFLFGVDRFTKVIYPFEETNAAN